MLGVDIQNQHPDNMTRREKRGKVGKTMENQENTIITRQEDINVNLQGAFCSFPAETDEQKANLYKAMTAPDYKLSDCINQQINAVDMFIEHVEIADDDSGEIAVLPRVVLFDDEGKTYAATSRGIFNAVKRLCLVYGMPHWEKPIPLIVRQIALAKGRTYTFDIGK